MKVINSLDLEISIEALRELNDEMKHKKQQKSFYEYLFKKGNTVSLYISGCPALILANITVKRYTEDVWKEVCHLIIEGDKTESDYIRADCTESEFIKLDYINDQPGFSAQHILMKCMH